MLVLTRRVGEVVVLDGVVRVVVTAIEGNRVLLSIIAPPDIRVDRQEVREHRPTAANPWAPAKG